MPAFDPFVNIPTAPELGAGATQNMPTVSRPHPNVDITGVPGATNQIEEPGWMDQMIETLKGGVGKVNEVLSRDAGQDIKTSIDYITEFLMGGGPETEMKPAPGPFAPPGVSAPDYTQEILSPVGPPPINQSIAPTPIPVQTETIIPDMMMPGLPERNPLPMSQRVSSQDEATIADNGPVSKAQPEPGGSSPGTYQKEAIKKSPPKKPAVATSNKGKLNERVAKRRSSRDRMADDMVEDNKYVPSGVFRTGPGSKKKSGKFDFNSAIKRGLGGY